MTGIFVMKRKARLQRLSELEELYLSSTEEQIITTGMIVNCPALPTNLKVGTHKTKSCTTGVSNTRHFMHSYL
jgi:hypothetical protein